MFQSVILPKGSDTVTDNVESIVVDELLGGLAKTGLTAQGYADDIILIFRGRLEDTLCNSI